MKTITLKEKKVLELLGQGYSSKQIASSLYISEHTVETHRKNLLMKFDAKNAAELMKKAIEASAVALNIPDMQPVINPKPYESDSL